MKVLKFSKIRLQLGKAPVLYYDSENERLYVSDEGTLYRYDNITMPTWLLIKQGDRTFFDQVTEVMPYRIVPNLPKTKKLDTYQLPMPTIVMWKVNSSNVEYVGYDADNQQLYVQYKGGDTYQYDGVEDAIWNGLRNADSKGSYLHWFVKINDYPYRKVSGFLLDWSGNYLSPNSGTPHEDGYLTGFSDEAHS